MNLKCIYNKYKNIIVGILLVLLCFKSCQSCSRNKTIEFNDKKNIVLVDSLKNHISILNEDIDSMRNDINIYINEIQTLNSTINIYKDANQILKDDNKHYRNTNRVLVNTNNQIINKDVKNN